MEQKSALFEELLFYIFFVGCIINVDYYIGMTNPSMGQSMARNTEN